MNLSPNQVRLDAQLRQLHADALTTLSPQTLARLRQARQDATRRPAARGRWWLATAAAAVLAAGLGVQQYADTPATTTPPPATAVASLASSDTDDLLAQNPDLYVWLGSENALAME
ncbi:hypothetical protein [Xanthomonas maliensis]|uniref:hypothetical protein n=1 Tax=Xanthomonas maliensis TaxID=1321368 RepID=UPI001264EAAF|nr:hypothetical protein [Xanthomonas maliensis]KAB7765175.1 hypothetical protein CKY51_16005 [Xanthomonas maliensis]